MFSFTNVDDTSVRWEQDVKLVPGATHELSYWWYSANSQAYTTTNLGMTLPGTSFNLNAVALDGPTDQWMHGSTAFAAPASFGTVYFELSGNIGLAANTIYIDDVDLKPVS